MVYLPRYLLVPFQLHSKGCTIGSWDYFRKFFADLYPGCLTLILDISWAQPTDVGSKLILCFSNHVCQSPGTITKLQHHWLMVDVLNEPNIVWEIKRTSLKAHIYTASWVQMDSRMCLFSDCLTKVSTLGPLTI